MGRQRGGLPFDLAGGPPGLQQVFADSRVYCGGFLAQQVMVTIVMVMMMRGWMVAMYCVQCAVCGVQCAAATTPPPTKPETTTVPFLPPFFPCNNAKKTTLKKGRPRRPRPRAARRDAGRAGRVRGRCVRQRPRLILREALGFEGAKGREGFSLEPASPIPSVPLQRAFDSQQSTPPPTTTHAKWHTQARTRPSRRSRPASCRRPTSNSSQVRGGREGMRGVGG